MIFTSSPLSDEHTFSFLDRVSISKFTAVFVTKSSLSNEVWMLQNVSPETPSTTSLPSRYSNFWGIGKIRSFIDILIPPQVILILYIVIYHIYPFSEPIITPSTKYFCAKG